MKTKLRKSAIFLMLIIAISSCGNKLSNGKATEMIKENINNNDNLKSLSLLFTIYDFYDFQSGIKYNDYLATYDFSKLTSLEKDGYIKILLPMDNKKKSIISFSQKAEEFTIASKSSKGRKYIAVGKMKDVNITGIKETGDKIRTVEYTITYEKTPFGILCDDSEFSKNLKARFALYDDGWRIEK
jgi:hypothetical protein